jgi:FKBP-type peptidyl-prolyl cis-trans isomerase
MKKIYLLIPALIVILLIAGCAGTQKEVTDISISEQEAPPVEVVETVEEQEATVIETPIEQEATVISESLPVSLLDADLDQKFSYVYGHLLAQGLVEQELAIDLAPFILGSSTFFNGEEPIFTNEEINASFEQYQSFLDGVISEEDFNAVQENGYSMKYQFSYGYGYVVQFNLQSQGILVSLEEFHSGISDAYAEIPLSMSDEEIDELFQAYIEKLNVQYEGIVEQMATANLADAEAFLEQNAQKEGIITTDSGLQYEVVALGEGNMPTLEDTVKVDYQLSFLDGTVGDNSYSRGEPSVFPVSNLIPGFIEGLTLMPVGSQFRFYVHPDLGYGETGNEMIPPNMLLVFDVELHEILNTTAQ